MFNINLSNFIIYVLFYISATSEDMHQQITIIHIYQVAESLRPGRSL
jgi:hypothetical protein